LIGRPAAARLREVRRDLGVAGADVKWVRDDHFHMTLAFLGKQNESRVSAAVRAGEAAVRINSFFRLRFNCLGAFPGWKRPKVLWAGLSEGAEAMKKLSKDLRERLESEGFETEDRPFVPHATLGRVRSPRGIRELSDRAERWREVDAWDGAECGVESITLFESRLSPSGPAYIPLAEAKLA
jgi:2'-5' RNA ligase